MTPAQLVARLNGQEVNLWDLYSTVLEMGGSYRVNQLSQWDQVYARIFRKPPIGVNVSVALRQVYQRYLIAYERANTSNFNSEMMDEDEDGHDTMNKNSFLKDLSSTSFSSSFNTTIGGNVSFGGGNVSMNQSMYQPFGVSTGVTSGSSSESFVNPLNKLYCSLVSGFPNEVEFGLKVTSMLANSKQIDWISDFKFIEVLLESLNLYVCICNKESDDKDAEDHDLGRLKDEDSGNVQIGRMVSRTSESTLKVPIKSTLSPYKRTITTVTNCTPTKTRRKDGVEEVANHDQNNSDKGEAMLIDLVVSPSKIIERRLSAISPSLHLHNRNRSKKWMSQSDRNKCRCFQKFWNQVCDDPNVLSCVFEEPLDRQDRENDPHHLAEANCDKNQLQIVNCVSNCDIDETKVKMKRIAVIIRAITEFIRESAIASSSELDGFSNLTSPTTLGLEPAPLSLLRFISLLTTSNDSSLINLGLDIISNVSLSPSNLPSITNTGTIERVVSKHEEKDGGDQDYDMLQSVIFRRCVTQVLESH